MAGEKGGGGKETGGAQHKRVESLEMELGTLYDRLENQGHKIQHQADSIASIQLKIDQNQLKMEQKFEEILGAIAKGNQGKTIEAGEPSSTPVISMERTPKGYTMERTEDASPSSVPTHLCRYAIPAMVIPNSNRVGA